MDTFFCDRQLSVLVNRVLIHQIGPRFARCPPGHGSRCTLTILQKILIRNQNIFAGDCVCYREVRDNDDTVKPHEDIDYLGCLARSRA